jgi:hypothetical protein
VAGQDALCVGWPGFAGTLFAAMRQVWLTRSKRSQVTDSCPYARRSRSSLKPQSSGAEEEARELDGLNVGLDPVENEGD